MQWAGYGPRHTAIENMVLAVGDNAVTYYRQSLYNANRRARHAATMTGHRQPEFAIGKVLVRLKVTRLMWECNRASFVDPRNCPLFFVEKRPF
jgi:hypothetical protein